MTQSFEYRVIEIDFRIKLHSDAIMVHEMKKTISVSDKVIH